MIELGLSFTVGQRIGDHVLVNEICHFVSESYICRMESTVHVIRHTDQHGLDFRKGL